MTMPRMLYAGLLALVLIFGCANSANADWWGSHGGIFSSNRVSYYYPVYYSPIYYYPAPVYACPTLPMVRPITGIGGYAQPVPAPPSTGKEPPLATKKGGPPQISESKSIPIGDG